MTICEWPVVYPGDCPVLDNEGVEALVYEQIAVDLLRAWTGYGVCPVVLRPCHAECWAGRSTFWGGGPYPTLFDSGYGPALVGGTWANVTCGLCGDDCSCDAGPATLRLPPPVYEVASVTIDGVAVAPEGYRVDNSTLLVRLDGGGWPRCQDMGAAAGQPGSFVISYTAGVPAPVGGQVAAGVLACELAKAAVRDPTCQLPQRVQTITRQGVTVAMLDSFEDVNTGRTGIWLVDSWVASVTKAPRAGRVYSVDLPRPRNRRQTPAPIVAP